MKPILPVALMLLLGFRPGIFDAQIICTPAFSVMSGNATLDIDVNNDSNADFRITSAQISTLGFVVVQAGQIGTNNSILSTGSNSAACLPLNAVIGATSTTWTQMNSSNQQMILAQNTTITGTWAGAISQYLGLKFIVGTNTYYGWAKFTFSNSSNTYTFSGYAYNSAPGQPILAGQGCGSISAPYFGLTPTVCAGSSVIVTANTGTDVPSTYSWIASAPGASIASPGASATSIAFNTAGVFTIALAVTGGTNAGGTTNTISVTAPPSFTVSPSSVSVCAGGQAATLTASGTAGNYSWTPTATLANVSGSVVMVSPSITTTYSVTGQSGGCSTSTVATVIVVPSPSATIALSSGSMCAMGYNGSPDSIAISFSSNTPSFNISAPLSLSVVIAGNAGSVTAISPFTPGIKVFTISMSNGVCVKDLTVSLNVVQNPSVTVAVSPPSVCVAGTFSLQGSGAINYTWTSPASFFAGPGFTTFANASMTYSTIGDQQGCFSETKTASLIVHPAPSVTAQGFTACAGITATVNASGASAYSWAGPGGFTSTAATFTIPALSVGVFQFTVTGYSAESCSATAVATVLSQFCTSLPSYDGSPTIDFMPGEIWISARAGGSVLLTDLSGQTIREWTFTPLENPLTVQLPQLPGGVYVIAVRSGKVYYVKKLVR